MAHVDPVGHPLASRNTAAFDTLLLKKAQYRNARQTTPFMPLHAEFRHMTATLTDLKQRNAALEQANKVLNIGKQEMESRIERLAAACEGKEVKTSRETELEAKCQQLQEQVAQALKHSTMMFELQQKLTHTEAALKDSREKAALAERERKEMTDKVKGEEADKKKRQALIETLKGELANMQGDIEKQRESYAAVVEENNRLTPMVLDSKAKEVELHNKLNEVEEELKDLRDRVKAGQLVGPGGGNNGGGDGRQRANSSFVSNAGSDVAGHERTYSNNPSSVVFREGASHAVPPTYIAHDVEQAHDGDIHSLVVGEHSKLIWTGSTDKSVKAWDISNGNQVHHLHALSAALCLDQRKDLLIGGFADKACRVWQVSSLRSRAELTGHIDKVTAAYFSYDGKYAYSGSSDRTLKLWDLSRGGALVHTGMCYSAVHDLAVAPDRIASAHFDNHLRFWDVRTWKSVDEIKNAHERTITSCKFLGDASRVATLSRDNTVKVFDVKMMKEVVSFQDDDFIVSWGFVRLGVSPDGRYLAAGSTNGVVSVFDVATETCVGKLKKSGHKGAVAAACWSPDARGLATVGSDRRLIFWR